MHIYVGLFYYLYIEEKIEKKEHREEYSVAIHHPTLILLNP